MTNVQFRFEGDVGYGALPDGTTFLFDAVMYDQIKNTKWYNDHKIRGRNCYVRDNHGNPLHLVLFDCPKGLEVDHINLDTLDNRSSNIRFVTHQQNQINQPIQSNNKSGVSGVRFSPRYNKYHSRIKISQHTIHLGYYEDFVAAVQARNVGMECMFGEYGRYNDVPPAPEWIREKVISQCKRFANLSVCEAFRSAYGAVA